MNEVSTQSHTNTYMLLFIRSMPMRRFTRESAGRGGTCPDDPPDAELEKLMVDAALATA